MKRRDFVKLSIASGLGISLPSRADYSFINEEGKRIGIIGLDTSHSIAFTKIFNDANAGADLAGYKVVAAYPYGSKDIKSSVERIPEYIKEIQDLGVKIVSSIEELLTMVDVVMLETNDGRLHLEQSIPVFKAGKRLFIDKPIAASLTDVAAILDNAKQYNVPVFSSSSLRCFENVSDLSEVGAIVGVDSFSPATLEPTHADLYWYGIHGVEILYTVLGSGCKTVQRTFTDGTDLVVGVWDDNRVGTFRGIRSGKKDYGGIVFGEKSILTINPGKDYGYRSLMVKVAQFFKTGVSPVPADEMLEIYTFMAAAEESSKKGGIAVSLEETLKQAKATKK
jgi:hypothetical protein